MITEEQARDLVGRIQSRLDDARDLVLELYQGEGWKALGYANWHQCVAAEFAPTKQRDIVVLALAQTVLPQLRQEAKESKLEANKNRIGKSVSHNGVKRPTQTQQRFRNLVGEGRKADDAISVSKYADLVQKVEKEAMSLKEAAQTARERNREASESKPSKPRKSVKNTKPKKEVHNQAYWWEQYKIHPHNPRGAEIFEKVHAPSTYPLDAKIPSGDTPDERFVRNAIAELRKSEALIPNLGKLKLEELIYPYTQGIQTYVVNRDDHPRPEGELDERLYKWAVVTAKKMNGMHDFLRFVSQQKELEKAAREESQETNRPKLSEFEYYFRDLWEAQRPFLGKFKIRDLDQLKERWLERVDKYFQHRAKNAQYLAENRANNGSIK